MWMGREDASEAALAALRARLRDGQLPPGSRIAASPVAASLHLSATPVREALCRLAGEGLVEERRRQGFFVRTLSGVDVADLYRMALAQLLILSAGDRGRRLPDPETGSSATGPVPAVEAFFLAWVGAAGSRTLIETYRIVSTQLGPVRRVEPLVFDDLASEAAGLFRQARLGELPELLHALRKFHGRRIQAADRLAAALIAGRKI